MNTVKVADLRDGMRFDKPVYVDGDNVFVPAGIPIRQKDIEFLARFDIAEVRTDGQAMADHPADAAAPLDLEGLRDLAGGKRGLDVYLRSIDVYEHVSLDVAEGRAVERAPIDAIVAQLLECVRDDRVEMIHLILMGGRTERRIAARTVNVAILSAVMGVVLKYTGHRLNQLVTGAFLHDLGMVKVPKEILRKKEKLSADELNQIRTHPIHAYRVIAKELKYPEDIGIIALQHHEKWDGTGYPRRLKGEDINLSARIVAVADAYVAMINERPDRDAVIGHSALKAVLADNGRHFDPRVLKAFIESMGIYPIGSVVQLNNSAIGRVVASHPEVPLRPVVELIVDEYGNQLGERETLDLLEKKGLFIVKALDPRALGLPPEPLRG
jgi:HD-GYP domain-containing protein (c-di-GMP phosphodiesterase class II)